MRHICKERVLTKIKVSKTEKLHMLQFLLSEKNHFHFFSILQIVGKRFKQIFLSICTFFLQWNAPKLNKNREREKKSTVRQFRSFVSVIPPHQVPYVICIVNEKRNIYKK